MSAFAKVVSIISAEKVNGKRAKTIYWRNLLKISKLFCESRAVPGERSMGGGGFVLTVAFYQGGYAGELALDPDFGVR
jgi:hypothetical protein